jgi:hypothetical protein
LEVRSHRRGPPWVRQARKVHQGRRGSPSVHTTRGSTTYLAGHYCSAQSRARTQTTIRTRRDTGTPPSQPTGENTARPRTGVFNRGDSAPRRRESDRTGPNSELLPGRGPIPEHRGLGWVGSCWIRSHWFTRTHTHSNSPLSAPHGPTHTCTVSPRSSGQSQQRRVGRGMGPASGIQTPRGDAQVVVATMQGGGGCRPG